MSPVTCIEPFRVALEAVDACCRSLPPTVSPTAALYLQAAFGSLINARDVYVQHAERDRGSRWAARMEALGRLQAGDRNSPLSDGDGAPEMPVPPAPDLGATIVRADALRSLATTRGFSAMLAHAIGEHRWLHVASGATWTCSWPGADAIVRALNEGRSFPRVTAAEMRGTIDRRVAEELARLGWRRISSPGLPEAG